MSKKDQRRELLLRFIRKRSGRRFILAVMAKELNVSERTIQDDLSVLEASRLIKRTPSYNSLHRQNGNIIVYTGNRKRRSQKLTRDRKDGYRPVLGVEPKMAKRPIFLNRIRSETHFTVSLTCYGKAGYPLPSFQG